MNIFVNAARRLEAMFPGYFQGGKHNHYTDFGWPSQLTFDQFFGMYQRNGIARAAVNKTQLKTWQDMPQFCETEDAEETPLENEIRQYFDDLRFWQNCATADARSLVGGYSGLILRVADNQRFDQPVIRVRGGLQGLVEVIPAWAGQLVVSEWDEDQTSINYGRPKMFRFSEAQVSAQSAGMTQSRAFDIHPDRVIVWSASGTVHDRSALEPGYNDLMTLEKVSGAGGEGFWKNAKSSPMLQIPAETSIKDLAAGMGVQPSEVADAMNEQVEAWQKGFDKLLMLQGMEAKTLGVTLPSPEHFFNIALQSFASSMDIPLKILVGMQTGERASTEDAREWSMTCNSRRNNVVKPILREFLKRMETFGILPEKDWHIDWADLTESTMEEKLSKAERMANINAKITNEPVFLPEEIREVLDMDPLSPADIEDHMPDPPVDPNNPDPNNPPNEGSPM